MALFRLSPASHAAPLVRGEGIYLRPPEMRDYEAWADLRARSRAFLTPWEPTWPADDLTRASFRRRLRHNQQEIANDEAYPFLIFRDDDDVLVGGLSLGQIRARRRAGGNARILDRRALCPARLHVRRGPGSDRLRFHHAPAASDRSLVLAP